METCFVWIWLSSVVLSFHSCVWQVEVQGSEPYPSNPSNRSHYRLQVTFFPQSLSKAFLVMFLVFDEDSSTCSFSQASCTGYIYIYFFCISTAKGISTISYRAFPSLSCNTLNVKRWTPQWALHDWLCEWSNRINWRVLLWFVGNVVFCDV